MPTTLKIELTPAAQNVVANLRTLPPRIVAAIASGMDKANQVAVATIQRDHMTGVGPFPPEQHKLGVRSSRLRSSINATPATTSGTTISSSIGSNVLYAAIHEFGGVIHREARTATLRLRLDARGNLVRQGKNKNLARFARADHKRAKEIKAHVGAYDITMPERAPVRTGIQETLPTYKLLISQAILREWGKLNS